MLHPRAVVGGPRRWLVPEVADQAPQRVGGARAGVHRELEVGGEDLHAPGVGGVLPQLDGR